MPTMPNPVLTGVRTVIGRAGQDGTRDEDEDEELFASIPGEGRRNRILVTREQELQYEARHEHSRSEDGKYHMGYEMV